ncbi:guanylin-like [Megalops cyprinoides]|uniref:guanylin-like n=1 Tax=Megalops cyprinoides TaxID=118141 RepID=UPI001863DA7E|nr:guanylin-like [Megalops cyprinoides]
MKTVLSAAALLITLCVVTDAVQVKEGDFTFSLESVKKLKDLMGVDTAVKQSPRLAKTSAASVCTSPDLPAEFRPVCETKGAAMSFFRLGFVAARMDLCEICAFAACTGCLFMS